MISNSDVSRLFSLYAELLLVHRQDERLSDLLSGASYRIRRMDTEVLRLTMSEKRKLFRPPIVALLEELLKISTISSMDELVQLTPPGLFDMMRVKGLGGKKLALLWKTAKVDSLETLLGACKANKLSQIPGFGVKTQNNIISAIEHMNSHADLFHYADVADAATTIVTSLQKLFKNKMISLCGDVRRQSTTVEAIEVITALTSKQFNSKDLKKIMTRSEATADLTKGHSLDELPIVVYHSSPKAFYKDLFLLTGNEAHVRKVGSKLRPISTYSSEEALYERARLPYIVPEMREDIAEWQYAKNGGQLITDSEIKGVVHNHTTWSDGVDGLSEFVLACKKRKYEYVVISDHSKNAHYAGGLKPDKVLRQFDEIDRLNKELSPFKIFKSIECDILVSGELDYEASLLKQFDLVIVSIHQLLKMTEEKATARLIKAIENPYTTILGHMTGRQLLLRPGYPVDFKKVIDACAANRVIIEINANPYRLDMDWSHIPYALKKGVMISINPDAHSIHEIDNIRWGVSAARKGGLTRDMTWNAMSLEKIERWLARRR
jgi:DNA polymerase (family 10)